MLLKFINNINFNLKFMLGYVGLFLITFILALTTLGIFSLKESDNARNAYLTYNNNSINESAPDSQIMAKTCPKTIAVHNFVLFPILFIISLLSLTSVLYMPSLFNDFNVIKKYNLSSAHPCELSKISNNILYWHIALFQFIMSAWLIPIVYIVFYIGFSLGSIMLLFIMLLMYLLSVLLSSLTMVAVKINGINFDDKCTDRLIEKHRYEYECNIIFGSVYYFITVCIYCVLLACCIGYLSNKSTFLQNNFEIVVLFFCIAYMLIMSYFTYFKYFKYFKNIKNQHIEYLKYLANNINEFDKYYNQKFINLRINLVMILGYITIFYLPILIWLNGEVVFIFFIYCFIVSFIVSFIYCFIVSLTRIINKNHIPIVDGMVVISFILIVVGIIYNIVYNIVFNIDLLFYLNILNMLKYYFLFCIILYFVWKVTANKRQMSDINEAVIIIIIFTLFIMLILFMAHFDNLWRFFTYK